MISALRERRLHSGLTQAQLAERAQVSRQLVAAVEAGRNVPAVDAALALARVLGCTVEALFGPPAPEALTPALGVALPDGVPVRVGRVADRLITAELADHGVAGAGWATADATLQAGELALFEAAAPAGLVVAGCDPALGVAERMLERFAAHRVLAISAPTGVALRALGAGTVHAAVVHGLPGSLPRAPVPVVRWHLASWQVGLAVAPGVRRRTLESVLAGGVRVAQRDPAAASQQALERARLRAGIETAPRGPTATGHLDAARIAAAAGCAAVTTEGAARAFGLRFLALEDHAVQIWIARRWVDHAAVRALGELLATPAFTQRVACFGGYDLSRCGEQVTAA